METFTNEYYKDQEEIFENILTRVINGGDKFSAHSVANICVFMKQMNVLVDGLLKDVESGKIGKTPKKFRKWKKKKMQEQIKTTKEETHPLPKEENDLATVFDFYK